MTPQERLVFFREIAGTAFGLAGAVAVLVLVVRARGRR